MRGREEKREREKKGERGRKKREGGEKRCAGKVREYFQRCLGRFSTILCLENLPQHLANDVKGRKEGEWEEKYVHGREKNIFKCAGEGFPQCYLLKTFPSTLKD